MGDPLDKPWTEADEVVEEVRQIRWKISAQFDHDVERLGKYLMELQQQHPERLWDPRNRDRQDKPAA